MYNIESLTGSRQVVLKLLYSCSGQFTMRQTCPRTTTDGFKSRAKDTTQAARQNAVSAPCCGMDPVKLVGVTHFHIFARCPVVFIQRPVVIHCWCLIYWSAKISWADVVRMDIRGIGQGIGIVQGIATLSHVLVFTTQVKVRVHVDQVGELIEQTSEMVPKSSMTQEEISTQNRVE